MECRRPVTYTLWSGATCYPFGVRGQWESVQLHIYLNVKGFLMQQQYKRRLSTSSNVRVSDTSVDLRFEADGEWVFVIGIFVYETI